MLSKLRTFFIMSAKKTSFSAEKITKKGVQSKIEERMIFLKDISSNIQIKKIKNISPIGKKIKLTDFKLTDKPIMIPNTIILVFVILRYKERVSPRNINKNENERLSVSIVK